MDGESCVELEFSSYDLPSPGAPRPAANRIFEQAGPRQAYVGRYVDDI